MTVRCSAVDVLQRWSLWGALALWLCLVTLISPAQAQQPKPSPDKAEQAEQPAAERAEAAEEMEALEAKVDSFAGRAAELASDCTAACEALAAMQRAASRICELDNGPRCAAARDKVERTRRRLLEACPDCLVAKNNQRYDAGKRPAPAPPPTGPATRPEALKRQQVEVQGGMGAGADEPAPGDEVATVESRRGGCAACAVAAPSHEEQSGPLSWWLLGAALLLSRRLRRHR